METNPYSPPVARDIRDDRPSSIAYRVFGGRSITFRLTVSSYRDAVRRKAQQAIDAEIGADNVVSIAEHGGAIYPFTVAVWYRVR